MTFLLLALCLGGIPLPEELYRISEVEATPDRFYVLEDSEDVVFAIDRSGKELARFGRRGQGPGEFAGPIGLALDSTHVYVADLRGQKVVVLTHDLEFVSEHGGMGLVRDLAVTPEHIFTVAYDPEAHATVRRYDRAWNQTGSFGYALPHPKKTLGHQSAEIAISGDRIYLVHTFRMAVEVFDFAGNLLETLTPPGFTSDSFLADCDFTELNWFNGCGGKRVLSLQIGERGALALSLSHDEERSTHLYIYTVDNEPRWLVKKRTGRAYADYDGRLFSLRRDEEDRYHVQYGNAALNDY